jgi:hypothetical protein
MLSTAHAAALAACCTGLPAPAGAAAHDRPLVAWHDLQPPAGPASPSPSPFLGQAATGKLDSSDYYDDYDDGPAGGVAGLGGGARWALVTVESARWSAPYNATW